MKNIVKESYRGFKGWLYYIRDYKDNVENEMVSQQMLVDANRKIENLTNQLKREIELSKEKDDLLSKRNDRVRLLTEKLTDEKIKNKMRLEAINELSAEVDELEEELNNKESQRRKNASAIGGLNKRIHKLEKELEKANLKITWLSNNQKAPTKEEIIAYETRQKEVEKRQKNGKPNNNI